MWFAFDYKINQAGLEQMSMLYKNLNKTNSDQPNNVLDAFKVVTYPVQKNVIVMRVENIMDNFDNKSNNYKPGVPF